MAELEKGIYVDKDVSFQVETDTKPNPKKVAEVQEYLSKNVQSRRTDKVPFKFEGKGHHGYLCYDVVTHRGKSAPQVTQKFKDLVRHVGSPTEHVVNKEQVRRMKVGGPRYADMGKSKRRKWMR